MCGKVNKDITGKNGINLYSCQPNSIIVVQKSNLLTRTQKSTRELSLVSLYFPAACVALSSSISPHYLILYVYCKLHIGKVIKNVKHLTLKGMGGKIDIFENWFWFGCIRTLTPFFSAYEHRRNSIEVSISAKKDTKVLWFLLQKFTVCENSVTW